MTDGSVLGVDLGTSHTVAVLRWPDGRTRPLLFDGQPLLPSAIYLDTTGRLHVGRDAVRLGQAEPGRLEPHPKRHVDAGTVLLGGAEVPTPDLLAALLGAVAREAVAAIGFLPPAVLTHPAAWGAGRREVLMAALARAGWPPTTRLLSEPVAAARYFADVLRRPVPVGSALAVFDFGGGTLDIAVVRNEGVTPDGLPRFAVAASGGVDDLGGLDLDAAVVEHLRTQIEKDEPAAWAALTEPVTLAQWRARRQFWEDVRGAKEMLSRTAQAPVPVPGVEHAVQLTREEFEAAAGPLIRRGVAEAGTVIRAAGLTPRELAGLFLVGGSSRVPLVARLLHSELGIAPTVLEQPELPVAEGALIAVSPAPAAAAAAGPHGRTQEEPMRPAAVAPKIDTVARGGPASTEPAGPAPAHGPVPANASAAQPMGQAHAPAAQPMGQAHAPAVQPVGQYHAPAAQPVGQPHASAAQPVSPGHVSGGQPVGRPAAGLPSAAPISPAPQYAEPVDPWATAEAEALAAAGAGLPTSGAPASAAPVSPSAQPWLASTLPDPEDEKPKLPAYRKKGLWLVAAATVVVLGAAATAVVLAWPGYAALDYRPLTDLRRIPPAAPVTSAFNATAVRDGRAYFASADDKGTLGIVAVPTDAAASKGWTSVAAGAAVRWDRFFVLPAAVVAITDTDSNTDTRRMVLLNTGDGKKLWERVIGRDDSVRFTDDTVVLVDRTEHRLLGLKIHGKGAVGWESKNPKDQYGGADTQVVAASTEEDFAGPAATTGTPFAEPLDDDRRVVQIGADRSARVIDTATGDVLAGPRQSVAGLLDWVVAHNDRLVVAESGDARRIVAYDLAKLGEPRVLYTAASADIRFESLTACGADRVCLVEKTGYDAKTAQVVAIDVAKGGDLWHRAVANVDGIVPVGESILASQNTSPVQVSLVDPDGDVTWTRPGVAGRLDGGNILQFSKALSASVDDPALDGEHLGDDRQPLGSLADVRSSTCSWDTRYLACVAAEDFVIQRFAE